MVLSMIVVRGSLHLLVTALVCRYLRLSAIPRWCGPGTISVGLLLAVAHGFAVEVLRAGGGWLSIIFVLLISMIVPLLNCLAGLTVAHAAGFEHVR